MQSCLATPVGRETHECSTEAPPGSPHRILSGHLTLLTGASDRSEESGNGPEIDSKIRSTGPPRKITVRRPGRGRFQTVPG